MDRELLARNSKLTGFRYVDDYELAFRTLREAEQALVDLQSILAGYELLLNPRKTRIIDLPQRLDTDWAIELKALVPGSDKRPIAQRNQVIAFFSRAFALAADHPSESVLRYAVASVQGLKVDGAGWRAFHNCVLGAAGADASTLAVALGTLFTVSKRGGHAVPIGPLSEVIDSVVARHAPRQQASEVAWALWAALAWNVPLSTEAARLIEPIEDDVVALLALHADDRQLWKAGTLTKSTWAGICSQPGVLESEHWLLAYEANQQGWLNVPAVGKFPAFAALSSAGVRFYNRSKANPQFPLAGRTIPGGDLASDYA